MLCESVLKTDFEQVVYSARAQIDVQEKYERTRPSAQRNSGLPKYSCEYLALRDSVSYPTLSASELRSPSPSSLLPPCALWPSQGVRRQMIDLEDLCPANTTAARSTPVAKSPPAPASTLPPCCLRPLSLPAPSLVRISPCLRFLTGPYAVLCISVPIRPTSSSS